ACDAGSPASVLHSILYKSGLKLAVAESCTGGLLSRLITDNSGSSDYFMGGVVSYHNDLKTCFLGVSEELLEEHGAVSEEVARAMLVGLFKHHRLDLGVAITGIAGPEGGTPDKPVGTVHFAFRDRGEVWSQKLILTGNREMIRIKAAEHALITMIRKLGAKIF
ncbi:MAG: CinA family protein, partial [Candidatus Cloacimonadota bacterium]